MPSTSAAIKRSITASVAARSTSPRWSNGVTIAGISPVNIELAPPVFVPMYAHPTPTPAVEQEARRIFGTPPGLVELSASPGVQ
jgi:hypothetical protein